MSYRTFTVSEITLHLLRMRLKNSFQTSFGTLRDKEFFVIELKDKEGHQGFGESVAFTAPWYTEETVKTTEHMMTDFLIPLIFQAPFSHPSEITERFASIRRNQMAKAGLEAAVWDLYARRQKKTLASCLGGTRQSIDVGVSIGIQPTVKELLNVIEHYAQEGYKRIKIKIKPGWDVEVIKEIRQQFPDLPLMADANSAYTLNDIDHLKKLDQFNLMMIEQPLGHDDKIEHAKLQRRLETPICLDESIHSFQDVIAAVELGSCRIINVKIGRVGGLTETKKINDYCKKHGIPVWCGGMLEAGIGRAHNIAAASLEQFSLPGDTSGSDRYWENDIITPEVTVKNGAIQLPEGPGIGYEIDWGALASFRIDKKIFQNHSFPK